MWITHNGYNRCGSYDCNKYNFCDLIVKLHKQISSYIWYLINFPYPITLGKVAKTEYI